MSPLRMSKVETASRIALALIEVINNHDIERMINLISKDCSLETSNPAPDGVRILGKEAIRDYWINLFVEKPDLHVKVEEIMGFGLRCLLFWRIEWTDKWGEKAHLRGIDIYKIREDKIDEMLSFVKG